MGKRLSPILLALLLVIVSLNSASGADQEALARQLLNSQGCKACHRLENSGGDLGPGLDRVGQRLSLEQLLDRLRGPATGEPPRQMPSFVHLGPERLQTLADFLATLGRAGSDGQQP